MLGLREECSASIVIITTSAPGRIYTLMFYSSPLSNAALNYTERRQRQPPTAPTVLLQCEAATINAPPQTPEPPIPLTERPVSVRIP